ncbi:hypothetical protein L7F22_006442 [Adiantum nelumboides]|nr:hypothetical protein [Adiantum nelumboides]
MAVSFPTFYGHHDENARDFMDSLEMAHLMAGRDQEEVKLRAFPLVLKGKARVWYDALAPPSKATWPTLYGAFLNKYGQGDTPENLWKQLLQHCQGSLGDYNTYESKFTNLWERWAASLQGQGGAPNFLKRDKFVEGMFPTLKEKVKETFPQTFEEAQEIATVKFKKLLYQERKSNCVKEREEINVPQHTNNAQPRVASISADSHQEDLLHKLTQQLETLTLNLVQAPTRGQQPRDDAQPLRRSTQELRCWNCNETGHGMYHCPHPRRIPGDMYPPRRPPQTVQFDVPQQPPTILRRPPPPPHPMAAVPPVPEQPEERGVNIIKLEEPEELNVMLAMKRTRAQERDEEMKSDTSDEPKKGKKKVKEDKAESDTIMPLDPQGIYYLCPSVGLDAFGAVLMQKDPKTAYMQPIYFTSKFMTQGQKVYTDIEQLVFSLIVAIRKFRSYLLPKPFIILTLEHNLPYAIQHMSISSKISKWVLELQEYEYTFIVENSTRASLADVLTYKVKEKKITPKAQGKLDFSPLGELEDAYTLLFDGAYRRQRNKAAGGFVILNEEKKEVQGTWACKNSKLLQWLHEVKLLMKDFEAIQIQHISRQHNKEAENMANTQFEVMVGAIKCKEPLFQGQETMEDILYFLETGECPKHLERVQRHCLVRKALSYQLIGEYLYHKGKDLVLGRVPLVKEIETILMSCHEGVCGGHFAQEITSRKILQAGFVWPSLHRDVQHWCKACKACQHTGDRKLSYDPRFPIFAYGPFEKWGINAIGPLPRTSTDKQYILTAIDYMTRWAEAASVARITSADVSKCVLDYICSRFGTPLEILSDRGPGFRADLLDALLENLSIKHVHSTPYYPQCNGLVEKTNGVLCKIITKHVRDRPQDWDKHLTAALWAYRTSFKVSTQFTPYHLVYGQEALLPIEVEIGSLRVLARETTSSKEKLEQRILDLQRLELDREAATDYYITQVNKKREQFNNKIKEKKLEEEMLVMRYDSRLDLSHIKKFLQRWEGPYVIFKKFKNRSYRLQDLSGKIHKYPVNGWRLKEFFQRIQLIQEERQVSLDA